MIKTTSAESAAANLLAILVTTKGFTQVIERINVDSGGVQSATVGTVPPSTRVVSGTRQ